MPIDYSKYPPNWKKEIVPAVRERSGGRCEFCGIPNKATMYSVKFKLQDSDGRYKYKRIWFSNLNDAIRADMFNDVKHVKVVLTVAHLDHDEENHDVELDRLKDACQVCHLNYDAKEKYQRKLKL